MLVDALWLTRFSMLHDVCLRVGDMGLQGLRHFWGDNGGCNTSGQYT